MGTLEELEIVVAQLSQRVETLRDRVASMEPMELSRMGNLRDSMQFEIGARHKITGEYIVVGWSQRADSFSKNRWALHKLPPGVSKLTHDRVVTDKRKPDPS